jgi:plastocyanin
MSARSMSSTGAALAAFAVAGLLAAGCGGGGGGSSNNSSKTVTVTAPAGGGTATVTIEAHDVFFNVTKINAPAGKLDIHYVEKGSQQHTLVIDGVKGFKLEVGPSSSSDDGTVTLAPGSYTYYCTIPGHRAQGMQGTITVAS